MPDDINMRDLFSFGSEVAADVNLVDGTSTYSLQSDFFAVREMQLQGELINRDDALGAAERLAQQIGAPRG